MRAGGHGPAIHATTAVLVLIIMQPPQLFASSASYPVKVSTAMIFKSATDVRQDNMLPPMWSANAGLRCRYQSALGKQ